MKATLPYPVPVNRMWRIFRNRLILSSEGRRYKALLGLMARSKGMRPIEGPISVTIRAYRPRKSGDLDGIFKGLFDALNKVAWIDDSQVVAIHAERFDDKDNPRVEVEVLAHSVLHGKVHHG